MQTLLIRFILNVFALWATTLIAQSLKVGIKVTNLKATIYAVLLLGFFSSFIAPVIKVLTMPLTCLTLGLFSFIVNAFLFYLAGALLRPYGFYVNGFWAGLWGSLIFSVLSAVLDSLLNKRSAD